MGPFELPFNGNVLQFKMVIKPKPFNEQRGGASFKKANGSGTVHLRCLDEAKREDTPVVKFQIIVGKDVQDRTTWSPPRGPVTHDFSNRALVGLPEAVEEWHFPSFVSEAKTF